MENFKKRNEKIKIENKIKYNKLNTDEEIRHENNLLKLNEENEKNMIKNKEKTFKKFCSFYWIRKNKVLEHIKKRKELKDKLYYVHINISLLTNKFIYLTLHAYITLNLFFQF